MASVFYLQKEMVWLVVYFKPVDEALLSAIEVII